jgi:hypothetical protein
VVLLFSTLWQQRWGTVVDTSWLITECQRLLAGEQLYVDLIENNPPFTVWLFLPAVVVSQWLGMTPEIGRQLYTYLAVIAGLALSAAIIRRSYPVG